MRIARARDVEQRDGEVVVAAAPGIAAELDAMFAESGCSTTPIPERLTPSAARGAGGLEQVDVERRGGAAAGRGILQ